MHLIVPATVKATLEGIKDAQASRLGRLSAGGLAVAALGRTLTQFHINWANMKNNVVKKLMLVIVT
jgi:hypothetical protein